MRWISVNQSPENSHSPPNKLKGATTIQLQSHLAISLSVAVELNYGTVYCFKCRDYIYDAELDQILRDVEQQLAHNQFHGEAHSRWMPPGERVG